MTRATKLQPAARFLSAGDLPEAFRVHAAAPPYRAALEALLPLDLLTATHFMRLDGETVWLRADSPAVATRLRQIQARLRRGLVDHGLRAAAIKVKVTSPVHRRREPLPRPPRPLPPAARQAFGRVGDRLPPGPLREAMLRLARCMAV